MPKKIVIIGGGPGGVAAAVRTRQLGAETTLIENNHLGGVCMNFGCIPMRVLGSAAAAADALAGAEKMGLAPVVPQLAPETLKKRLEQTVQYMRMGTQSLLKSNGVAVIQGEAQIMSDGKIEVGRESLSADAVILAWGAEWAAPQIPGSNLKGTGPPDATFDVESIPQPCLIYGEADWGVELAVFYSRFGSRVTLATPGDFLPRFDRQIGSRLKAALKKAGVNVLRQAELKSIQRAAKELTANLTIKGKAEAVEAARIVLTDRAPRIKGLNLAKAGIQTAGGAVAVNSRLETTRPGFFAIGDLTGPPYLSHKASAQGVMAAENALGGQREFDGRLVPSVVFTRPEAASVGLTEKQAREEYDRVSVGEVPYGVNARAMAELEDGGVVRVIFGTKYDKLLGVHLLGPHSAELITQAALALQLEATADELADLIPAHPSYAEALADAARMALGRAIYAPNLPAGS